MDYDEYENNYQDDEQSESYSNIAIIPSFFQHETDSNFNIDDSHVSGLSQLNCDHIKKKLVSDTTKECLDCGMQFCTHSQVDNDSSCLTCGELITEFSIEQSWCDAGYKNTAANSSKHSKDHAKYLETLGYSTDIIESAMEKFVKIGCSLSEEPAVVAVCVWLTLWDNGAPRTMVEIATKHGITKTKMKDGRKIVLSFDYFKSYRTRYITISSMIRKLLDDLKLETKGNTTIPISEYYKHIYEMTKHVEANWERLETTQRSAPQNIAAACVFVYIQNSPTLSHMIDTPLKKREVCLALGPSLATVEKLAKQIIEELIKIPRNL